MQKTPVPCTITYKGRELISRGATLIEAALEKATSTFTVNACQRSSPTKSYDRSKRSLRSVLSLSHNAEMFSACRHFLSFHVGV